MWRALEPRPNLKGCSNKEDVVVVIDEEEEDPKRISS